MVVAPGFLRENPCRRVRQIGSSYRRRNALDSLVQRPDLYRSTSGRAPGRHIPPSVADHKTSLKVDVESLGSFMQ
jgi:hypothetical protein